MKAVGVAVGTFIVVAGILLTFAWTGPQIQALVSAALVAGVAYFAATTRSMADLATVEKFRHEIPKLLAEHEKLRLEIQQLKKQQSDHESLIRRPNETEVINFSTRDIFRGDPPSKW